MVKGKGSKGGSGRRTPAASDGGSAFGSLGMDAIKKMQAEGMEFGNPLTGTGKITDPKRKSR